MDDPVIKAFVLCDEITNSAGGTGQKDLRGAGRISFRALDPFPIKRSFWVYIELTGRKPAGTIQLAIMRADSGRRFFFRSMPVEFPNRLRTTLVSTRVFDCSFPTSGIYYVELWYDGKWVIDQRLEVV
jgi:hypothetical protein